MSYNTKQKDVILEIIKSKKKEFRVLDIYNDLEGKVGLTTIYRLINKLVSDGIINKVIGNDNITYYEYLKSCNKNNHFFLKCNHCLKLIHIDCDCIRNIENHILEEHKFDINNQNLVINGLCNRCRRNV
ncbi:MAG: transcriptional repressor [Bacilli bacterium]|nr:transcriptional repressor [Bacilli bacterium]